MWPNCYIYTDFNRAMINFKVFQPVKVADLKDL